MGTDTETYLEEMKMMMDCAQAPKRAGIENVVRYANNLPALYRGNI